MNYLVVNKTLSLPSPGFQLCGEDEQLNVTAVKCYDREGLESIWQGND